MDAVLTTWPTPCSIMSGTNVEMPWMTPHWLAPRIQRQSSSLKSQIGPPSPTPALLWTRCTAPKRSSAWSRKARTEAPSDTSVTTPMASAPRAASSPSASFRGPSSMSAMTIFIPSVAARSATARPMPLAPPVITATLPCRSSTRMLPPVCLRRRSQARPGTEGHRHPVRSPGPDHPVRSPGPITRPSRGGRGGRQRMLGARCRARWSRPSCETETIAPVRES